MKPREPRTKVIIKARMRLDGVWADVCIRDISSRGLLVQAASAPARNSYVEIYRGRQVIVARVVWTKDERFGVQTQDRLDIDAVIQEPDLSGINYRKARVDSPTFERRTVPRQPSAQDLRWRAERSRHLSRAAEFACIGALTASAAILIFGGLSRSFAEPLAAVSASLVRP
jgi:hypothetical protein